MDDLDADEERYLDFYRKVAVHEDMLVPLAAHHDGPNSYYVLFDRAATWGPGMPQVLAVHLQRDYEKRTFSFEQAPLPLPAMAQSWLVHRGCPHDAISLGPELGPPPADEATRALERRLVGDGDRYAMGYSYTSDDPDDMVIVVVLRALDEQASARSAWWSRRSIPRRGRTPFARAASTRPVRPCSGATTASPARPGRSRRSARQLPPATRQV